MTSSTVYHAIVVLLVAMVTSSSGLAAYNGAYQYRNYTKCFSCTNDPTVTPAQNVPPYYAYCDQLTTNATMAAIIQSQASSPYTCGGLLCGITISKASKTSYVSRYCLNNIINRDSPCQSTYDYINNYYLQICYCQSSFCNSAPNRRHSNSVAISIFMTSAAVLLSYFVH